MDPALTEDTADGAVAAWRAWYHRRAPQAVRVVLLIAAVILALGAAIAPLVFLLRRTGVG